MSTKISALTAAIAGNITDATVLPLVDATTTTVKVTIAQLRTQLYSLTSTNAFFGDISIAKASGSPITVSLNQLGVVGWNLRNTATTGLFAIHDGTTDWFTIAVTTGLTTFAGATRHLGLVTLSSSVASAAGTGTDIVFGATTQTTIGANGAASALTANPLGYLVFYKGATKCILPYYTG